MQLVEQHVISKSDPRYSLIDVVAFASKNLYNAANYIVRQAFIHQGVYLSYVEVYHQVKYTEAYKALPAKVANDVLRQLDKNWQAFFAALASWKADPSRFLGQPRLPKYKPKNGRHILIYDIQAVSKRGFIQPSKLPIVVLTKQQHVVQVRIVPKKTHYVVEVVYEQAIRPVPLEHEFVAGIDNLVALTANKPGFMPVIVNGKPLKAINQSYNKRRSVLQSKLKNKFTSRQIEQLTEKRNRRIKHELHVASRFVVKLLIREGIGTLVIGKNPNWKQEINLGKRTNQNFVQLPHARFVEMLKYKAELVGIRVILTEENYTSKCSFLDLEPLGKQEHYAGKRIKRGLFRASNGRFINADVNGSYNIIRKVVPNAFGNGIVGVAVHPTRISL